MTKLDDRDVLGRQPLVSQFIPCSWNTLRPIKRVFEVTRLCPHDLSSSIILLRVSSSRLTLPWVLSITIVPTL